MSQQPTADLAQEVDDLKAERDALRAALAPFAARIDELVANQNSARQRFFAPGSREDEFRPFTQSELFAAWKALRSAHEQTKSTT